MAGETLKTRLHQGYRFKSRLVLASVRSLDFLLGLLPRQRSRLPEQVRRILLIKPDHLGDLLLTTAIFPLVAERYPGAAIDLLCGSWGKPVVAGNLLLRRLICFDHPLYDRSGRPIHRKLLAIWPALRHIIAALRRERYDLCLNLRDSGGDMILLARIGGCRHIVGHGTGGCGPLLDTLVAWGEGKHEAEHYLELLAPLGITAGLDALHYGLEPAPDDQAAVDALLRAEGIGRFAVIHPGSGDRRKARPAGFWAQVVETIPSDCQIIVTGTADEQPLYEEIAAATDRNMISFMGRLTVARLFALFRRAGTVYCLDSLAAHLGGAAGVRTVVYWSRTNDPGQWRPLGDSVELVLDQTG